MKRHYSSQKTSLFPLQKSSSQKRFLRLACALFLILESLLPISSIFAQSGVLIVENAFKPDSAILSLAVMNVDITLDNGRATVKIVQIFDNHSARVLEGKYIFALPQKSAISDFAVWEGDLRIPGVMMQKKRANRAYENVKNQAIDPGILQSTDETESRAGFSAKVFPINSFGTKRLEMEYTEDLNVDNLISTFSFPLKPSYGESQTVGAFKITLKVLNETPFTPLNLENSAFPLKIVKNDTTEFTAEFEARNLKLENDFSFSYKMEAPKNKLSIVTYRAPEKISAYDLRDPQFANQKTDGFFQAKIFFPSDEKRDVAPKRLVLLLDNSLSMYGDKLARAIEAIDFFLHKLSPADEFNLVLFNSETEVFSPLPLRATPENVEKAVAFVRDSGLRGGTNLKAAFEKAFQISANFSAGDKQMVLISDAFPTLETTETKNIERIFENKNAQLFAFSIGASNTPLLETLTAKTRGHYETSRETEDIALKLALFFEKIGTENISDLQLKKDENLYDIYPSGDFSYFGSDFSFVGRYKKPQKQLFDFSAQAAGKPINLLQEVDLPEFAEKHLFLPRVWAQARIQALLTEINRNGEREDFISEIIRLSEKYKILSPYTAFIAAPRALLRPRLIQPGDPVIRVKTDESISEVFAVLPFGETLPLKFLKAEGVWETRFLAPVWMNDGAYKCRLLLTDKNGFGYEEEKSFVIDSRPPLVKIKTDRKTFYAGETILLRVSADSDTSHLTAKLYGAKPARLGWSNEEKTNIGKLEIPENLASGRYVLRVTAEDFAHNQTTEELPLEVIGK